MSKGTFESLYKELNPFLYKEDTTLRKAVTIGHLLRISKSSVCAIVEEFSDIIPNKLLSKYICIPTGEDLEMIVREFKYRWGFPQCFGAIDGSHFQ